MHSKTPSFELPISNIPVINLRREFEEYLRLVKSSHFSSLVFNSRIKPVKIPNLVWSGIPDDLLTLMLQRSISGLESYVCAAVEYELGARQLLTEEIKEKLEEPFSLGKGRAVLSLYEKMPELISGSLKLSKYDSSLHQSVIGFYKKVRNPVFHGNQVKCNDQNYKNYIASFELIESVYRWVDSWYSAFPFGWDRDECP